nr:hypothetical protein [Tanacetum cinerariifolium]
VIQEPSESPTTSTTIPKQKSQDKGKGIMVEKPVKLKKKDQIRLDEETALKLQDEFDEEQRLAIEKAEKELEANIALKGYIIYAILGEKKKVLCSKESRREKKQTTNTSLKEKDNVYLPEEHERIQAQPLVEGKEKRAGEELEQERSRKQKVDDKETTELKKLMEIIPNEEDVAIDAIPLAVKSPGIVDWKIYKEGKKSYYQIIRADEKSKMYMFFSQMLTSFDREDLKDLYKLIKAKYGSTKPVEDLDLLLWGDLRTMFKPHVEDVVWRKQQGYKVLVRKLYDSGEVHS